MTQPRTGSERLRAFSFPHKRVGTDSFSSGGIQGPWLAWPNAGRLSRQRRRDGWSWRDSGDRPPRALSVALSGGGHRAALFGLGVLMYLADAGKNRQVGSIVSVSGGLHHERVRGTVRQLSGIMTGRD